LHHTKQKTLLQQFYEIASTGEKICYKPSNNLHHRKKKPNHMENKFCYNPYVELHQWGKSAMNLLRICNLWRQKLIFARIV
jgi:hypothetical protein